MTQFFEIVEKPHFGGYFDHLHFDVLLKLGPARGSQKSTLCFK